MTAEMAYDNCQPCGSADQSNTLRL